MVGSGGKSKKINLCSLPELNRWSLDEPWDTSQAPYHLAKRASVMTKGYSQSIIQWPFDQRQHIPLTVLYARGNKFHSHGTRHEQSSKSPWFSIAIDSFSTWNLDANFFPMAVEYVPPSKITTSISENPTCLQWLQILHSNDRSLRVKVNRWMNFLAIRIWLISV